MSIRHYKYVHKMTRKTGEQVKQERIARMGTEFGALYDSLYNEVVWIQYKWLEFVELFGVNEQRVDLMKRTAPWFFFITQKTLWESVLLGIAKITDKPVTAGKRTITLRAIPLYISDAALKAKVETQLEKVLAEAEFCRDWRNRVIAHKDLELNLSGLRVAEASRAKVKALLTSIHTLIQLVEVAYFNTHVAFNFLRSERGAIPLLYTLRDGLKYNRQRNQREDEGDFEDDQPI